jgi:hypothetical protein
MYSTSEQILDIISFITNKRNEPSIISKIHNDIIATTESMSQDESDKEESDKEVDNKYPNHRKGWSKTELEQLLSVKPTIKKNKKDEFEKMFGRKYSNIKVQLRKMDKSDP